MARLTSAPDLQHTDAVQTETLVNNFLTFTGSAFWAFFFFNKVFYNNVSHFHRLHPVMRWEGPCVRAGPRPTSFLSSPFFWQVPLRLIESVESRGMFQLHIICKDSKVVRWAPRLRPSQSLHITRASLRMLLKYFRNVIKATLWKYFVSFSWIQLHSVFVLP